MNNKVSNGAMFRMVVVPLVGLAMCSVLMPNVSAQRKSAVLEQFVGEAVSVSGSDRAGRIDIYIERWSTEAEAERLRGALREDSPASLLGALRPVASRVGVVLMPGVQARGARVRTRTPRNLLFARAIDTPSGRRIVAASGEHLGVGESRLDARREIVEFNLIDMRFGPDGTGIGKIVPASEVRLSADRQSLEARNYEAQPVRLVDVRVATPR